MNRLTLILAVCCGLLLPAAIVAQAPSDEDRAWEAEVQRIAAQLNPVSGDVRLSGADAVLHLGEDYYFLPADEARLVLTEAWGNPADATTGILGMVFPAGRTFADDTWGAVITFEASGYVSDGDAQSIDYAALLQEMQAGEEAVNEERIRLGFPAQHLVGWAQAPTYDPQAHSLVWARNIRFAGVPENTLNYDIRLLGRRGVLSLNMITVMSKLEETRQAAGGLAASAEFVPGERYADFNPDTDRVAEYGLAGLVAAGAGAAVAKKAGLLGILLALGKKLIVFVLLGIGLAWAAVKRLFNRQPPEEEYPHEEASEPVMTEPSTRTASDEETPPPTSG